jgi:hypothetical protein
MMKRGFFTIAIVGITCTFLIAPTLSLNSFRAQHGRPALSMSGTLAGLA